MCRLRRVKEKNGYLSNTCGYYDKSGTPMVGSKFCTNDCPHFKRTIKILHWEFVQCKYIKQLYVFFPREMLQASPFYFIRQHPISYWILLQNFKGTFHKPNEHPLSAHFITLHIFRKKNFFFLKKPSKKFGYLIFYSYLCNRK